MAQKEMTRITEERISEIISRIEMYGHGAGYTADEVLALAQMALTACKDDKKMKLIDLLVKELPKCGGWPDGMIDCRLLSANLMAPCATFAFGSDHKKDTFFGRNFCCEIELPIGDLDSDEYLSVVTREQYESALIASQKSSSMVMNLKVRLTGWILGNGWNSNAGKSMWTVVVCPLKHSCTGCG